MANPRGRPPSDNPKPTTLSVRLTVPLADLLDQMVRVVGRKKRPRVVRQALLRGLRIMARDVAKGLDPMRRRF